MSLDLPKTFDVAPPKPPEMQSWGTPVLTFTIRQAYYGISLSADPVTPPIKLGLKNELAQATASMPLFRVFG